MKRPDARSRSGAHAEDRHIEEVIALVSDYATAKSAFVEAVRRRPGKLITLRQKARVIQKRR